MQKLLYSLSLVLILTCSIGQAKPISKLVWMKEFNRKFVQEFCQADQIKKCHEVQATSCENAIPIFSKSCSEKIKLPNQVSLGPESGRWGADLGRCVGQEYQKKFTIKKNPESACEKSVF